MSTSRSGLTVALLVILGLAPGINAQDAKPPATFSIATYNINAGNVDLDTITKTIRQADADVVALQETNKVSEKHLRRALGNKYPHMAFSHAPAAGGFAILSKVPLRKVEYHKPVRSDGGWFGRQTAHVTLGGRDVMLVNVHLMPAVPRDLKNLRYLLNLAAKTDAVRQKEARRAVADVPEGSPAIMLGDFNSIPRLSKVPAFMKGSGFTDSLAEIDKDPDTLATWHWRVNGTEYSFHLDYIFTARLGAKCTGARVIQSKASDHYLVTCTYEWMNADAAPAP